MATASWRETTDWSACLTQKGHLFGYNRKLFHTDLSPVASGIRSQERELKHLNFGAAEGSAVAVSLPQRGHGFGGGSPSNSVVRRAFQLGQGQNAVNAAAAAGHRTSIGSAQGSSRRSSANSKRRRRTETLEAIEAGRRDEDKASAAP